MKNLEYVSGTLRDEIQDLVDDPTVSFWLSNAITRNLSRDPVDALNDAKQLVAILEDVLSDIRKYVKRI